MGKNIFSTLFYTSSEVDEGMTGSGRSSFIADSTGREDVQIGHDLASCKHTLEMNISERWLIMY